MAGIEEIERAISQLVTTRNPTTPGPSASAANFITLDDGFTAAATDGSTAVCGDFVRSSFSVVFNENSAYNHCALVPGRQSNFRAEVLGAAAAISVAQAVNIRRLRIFVDNRAAITTIEKAISASEDDHHVALIGRHADLEDTLRDIRLAVQHAGMKVELQHVYSHRNLPSLPSVMNAWADASARQRLHQLTRELEAETQVCIGVEG